MRSSDRSWSVFWLIDGAIGFAAACYVTVALIRMDEPIVWWHAALAYGACLAVVGLLALCYFALSLSRQEKVLGER
ncbi:hypothetical protein [Allokutzneria sp. NRRL B-24872]|uniref:hypothetical protein n=1 Tax=Allokutzneria sp. NRRL B-24872 TaxID=1137961 RepID=UPI000A371AFC|nr:hypothetical protein [Allokutzneria sp. NRRL B-24872]